MVEPLGTHVASSKSNPSIVTVCGEPGLYTTKQLENTMTQSSASNVECTWRLRLKNHSDLTHCEPEPGLSKAYPILCYVKIDLRKGPR